MENFPNHILLAGAVSALVAFTITPLIIKLANKLGVIDDPKHHKHPKVIHTYPVPRGGGLAIFAAIAISALIFLPLDKHLKGILAGALIITIVGILDDKYDLNPYVRLAAQFLAASAPIVAGIGLGFIKIPFLANLITQDSYLNSMLVADASRGIIELSQPQISFDLFGDTKSIWILSDVFALLWIVMLMNSINMGAKGVDGQLPGVAAIAAATIAVLSLGYSADVTQWPVIILAVIVSASFLGFLPWNIYPQKIMPSFSGSNLAGYFLGILSILSTAKVGTLLVVLGIPLVDTGYTIVRRIASGKSPVWGDRGHLHHKLLDSGFSKKQVVYFYWLATAALGFAALNLNASYKLYTIIGTIIFIGGLLLWLTYQKKSTKAAHKTQ